mmetsp:Transcript_20799/g.44355  ORF Transcript_20799/g.44355 Transcript_20799/m.44355 type:complete len:402 (-) Transcript_20799:51-1256(-)
MEPPSSGSRAAPPSRGLQRTGAHILGGRPSSGASSGVSAGMERGGMGMASAPHVGLGTAYYHGDDPQPAPPSVTRTGRLYAEDKQHTITPSIWGPADNVPAVKNLHMRRMPARAEPHPKLVWSDSMSQLDGDPWPAHAIPLFVLTGDDALPPMPCYKEEVQFTLHDDKYVNFAMRMRCGGNDRFMGGCVGLIHSRHLQEAAPGTEGQLITITDLTMVPNGTVEVTAVGDMPFRVTKSWLPRALRGLQLAFVEVLPIAVTRHDIFDTIAMDPELARFAQLLSDAAPQLAQALKEEAGPFTVFVPTGGALTAAEQMPREDLETLLLCHVCRGNVPFQAMYSGRALTAVDSTPLLMTFGRWPRHHPKVNDVPIMHMDITCSNGIVHTIAGLLCPSPAQGRRKLW